MTAATIFTIGHSNHSAEYLIGLLKRHAVNAVADVRSSPHSRVHPAFDRNALEALLAEAGLTYVFLGRELGGRSKLARDYDASGRVQYSRMAASDDFKRGIDRVLSGAKRFRVALLCAEKDPIECHRTLLVGRELEKRGEVIHHILADGRIESNDEAVARMLALNGMQELGLFASRESLIEEACVLQARKVAYVDPRMAVPAASK